jgi:hypothetical protein
MSRIEINGSNLGNSLQQLLNCDEIQPGDQPSYELCKTIYLYHPLGAKMAEAPIVMAQSQEREISIPKSPEERVRDAFKKQWEDDGIDDRILNVAALSRVYGIASIALLAEGIPANEPIDPKKLADLTISWNVFDPLNTAGSLVLNQDPNAMDFQKINTVAAGGVPYHRSRTVTLMNERPVYIAYTSAGFGFVGRSVYQRALFPLKSFVQSMVTDDLITKKSGVFIAKLSSAGAIIDNVMQTIAGMKRLFVQQATNGNIISIGKDEAIETLNMQNIDGAYGMARKNLLKNIATAGDMPAVLIENETLAEGFGEGTEDAKVIARYVDGVRKKLRPLYSYFDRITMYRAWNRDFYARIQNEFPEYKDVVYERAFYQWMNSFTANWPSLLTEPPSEKVKVDDVKLKAVIAMLEVLMPAMDPVNKATAIAWAQDNFNELKLLFQNPLMLDFDVLQKYVPPTPIPAPGEPKPFSAQDSEAVARVRTAINRYDAAQIDLFETYRGRETRALPPPLRKTANGTLTKQ